MLSISYDKFKFSTLDKYLNRIKEIKEIHENVACNLLVTKELIENHLEFCRTVSKIFNSGANRVFALCPKNWESPDILQHKGVLQYLSTIYEHFYVDDLTKQILTEGTYNNWKNPCHYGKGVISIDECGVVTGCSFSKEPLLIPEKPSDILKIKDINIEERYSCPYLRR